MKTPPPNNIPGSSAAADAAPEPLQAQGEYNQQAPEGRIEVPDFGKPKPKRAELLAPAGGIEAAYAAFHYGADAIYLGLKHFSARAEAENFTLDQVSEITAYAHALSPRRRTFVTVNTLVLQHELAAVIDDIAALADIGVDALIIQDLGVYRIVRKYFPELALHASTQMAVHNRAGAETLRELGFKRAILARELTLEEVNEITSTSGLETEFFVHGALCYAYSGLCLLSSQSTGRSGNRGRCAYSCRDQFTVSGAPATLRDGSPTRRDPSRGFAFSMKDLALPDHIPGLLSAGVASFKIEGRKKSPLYVATTTDFYRKLLDGTLDPAERPAHEADIKSVFSRPWTRLFVQSHRDKEVADRDTVGHRGTPIGSVEALVRTGHKTWLRFKSSRAVELHDGLQIDIPGLERPFGFAVDELRLSDAAQRRARTQRLYQTAAQDQLEVALPEHYPQIPLGATIYCSSSQAVKRRYKHARPKPAEFCCRRPIDIDVEITARQVSLRARVEPRHAHEEAIELHRALDGTFQPARDAARTEGALRIVFEKLGHTRLSLRGLVVLNPDGLFVPASLLNPLRRELTAEVEAQLAAALKKRVASVQHHICTPSHSGQALPPEKGHTPRWSIKLDRIAHLDAFEESDWSNIDEAVIDIGADQPTLLCQRLQRIAALIGHEHLRLALPLVTRKWEERALRATIERLRNAGFTRWEAANLSAWRFLDVKLHAQNALDLSSDWSIYVVNRAAALQALAMGARRLTLSPEDGLQNMQALLREFGEVASVIVHQDTPLFIAESCAYANLIGGCPGKAQCRFVSMDLVNGYGERVTAIDYRCRTLTISQGAFCLMPRLKELLAAGARNLRADFIIRPYSAEQVRDAWRLLRSGKNVPGGQAANFERGML